MLHIDFVRVVVGEHFYSDRRVTEQTFVEDGRCTCGQRFGRDGEGLGELVKQRHLLYLLFLRQEIKFQKDPSKQVVHRRVMC